MYLEYDWKCVRLTIFFPFYIDTQCTHSEEESVPSKKQDKMNNKKSLKALQNESDEDEDEGNC